jgi:hypothetical protein
MDKVFELANTIVDVLEQSDAPEYEKTLALEIAPKIRTWKATANHVRERQEKFPVVFDSPTLDEAKAG